MRTVDEIWQNYDSNNDEVLQKDEAKKFFMDYYTNNLNEDISEEKQERLFLVLDKNKDGLIQKSEMERFLNVFFNK